MPMKEFAPDVFMLPLGTVNVYVLRSAHGLILIDAGIPGSEKRIWDGIASIGYRPADVMAIILTHCHPDHVGSAAALKREAPQAKICISELDAPIVEQGMPQRPLTPAPGFLNSLLFRLFIKETPIEAVKVDIKLKDNDVLDFAGGLRAIQAPGHCLGQLAFLLPKQGGLLFAADTASNMMGLGLSIGYEDVKLGRSSLQKLGQLVFEMACFGHGKPILSGAAQKFNRKWPV